MKKRDRNCFSSPLLKSFLCGTILFFGFGILTVSAADLTFSPSSGTLRVGKPFTLNIRLAENAGSINALSGEVVFPQDMLSVSALTKESSFVKLWADEPHYSNEAGTVSFEGVILNPGFSGAEGTILSITFIPKKTGSAKISYSSGNLLANDGKGTSVLGSLGSASFLISKSTADFSGAASTPSAASDTPAAPVVTSSTHPDPSKWYSSSSASFSWQLPSDALAVRLLADTDPTTVPTHFYAEALSQKDVPDNKDGVHYFHVQVKNSHGWGAVSHFRYEIDTLPPQPFIVSFPEGASGDNPAPSLALAASDSLSGIDRYEVRIGEGDLLTYVPKAGSGLYQIPVQAPGQHTVVVRAVDRAGNSTTESADFTIHGILPPSFTRFPSSLEEGEILKIEGTTYPNASIEAILADSDGAKIAEEARSNSLGNFSLAWDGKLSPGVYSLRAQTTDSRGAKSGETDPIIIAISQRTLFRIGSLVVTYFMLGALVVLAFASLAFLVWHLLRRFSLYRKNVSRTVTTAEAALQKAFSDLEHEMRDSMYLLQKAGGKRELTKEERAIMRQLEKRLQAIDGDIEARLKGLKK